MNIKEFRHLAEVAGAKSVLKTDAVAVFSGCGVHVSVQADLTAATDRRIKEALVFAAMATEAKDKRTGGDEPE